MTTTSGVFMSHRDSFKYQVITKYLNSKIHRCEAAKLLSVSPRTITRYSKKVKKLGMIGVKHGNYGNQLSVKHPRDLIEQLKALYRTKYYDFNLYHFWEILEKEYKIKIPYKTLWSWFSNLGWIKNPRRRRPRKHTYRTRLPQEGLLLQMDGSHHKFNGKDEWCLISAIDDATSNIPYAELFSNGETTLNCMKVLSKIIELKGVPRAIYTDRAGWAGGGKRTEFGQFKRACDKLGIQLIFADTPEAKGRIERSFRTIQDRLIPELRLKEIKDLDSANKYLNDEFLRNYWNKKNVVKPIEKEPAYTPLDPWLDIHQILCVEEDRVINRDQTVSWQGKRYVVSDGKHSLANYAAVFRTDLAGHTRIFVLDLEVQLRPITEPIRRLDAIPRKEPLEIHHDLWIKMYGTLVEVGNAVKTHQVTGQPLKIQRISGRRAI